MKEMLIEWRKFLTKEEKNLDVKSKNKKHNLKKLSEFEIDPKKVSEQGILDRIKIEDEIESGDQGTIYSTEDGKVIKIFYDERFPYYDKKEVQRDIQRIQKSVSNFNNGTASTKDMPYYEVGKIGNTNLFYALMPKIVMFKEAPFFNQSRIFRDIADNNRAAAVNLGRKSAGKTSYDKFKQIVIEGAKNFSKMMRYDFDQEYNKYTDIIEKIIQAGYRAYKEFGGQDLHVGNIGYLEENPEEFFYFDM